MRSLTSRLLSSLSVLTLCALWLTACSNSDVGECCESIPGRDSKLPVSTVNNDEKNPSYTDAVKLDPAFDCASLTCVAYRGMPAYCTEPCHSNKDCPKGFSCEKVLASDPGPTSYIQPDDRFCVKEKHTCKK